LESTFFGNPLATEAVCVFLIEEACYLLKYSLLTSFSGVALGLYGALNLDAIWDSLSNSQRAQQVGFYLSVWFLFQGASATQIMKQEFGDGDPSDPGTFFFYILWAGEIIFIVLSVFVGLGGKFYSSLF